jgi:hypothetical protein
MGYDGYAGALSTIVNMAAAKAVNTVASQGALALQAAIAYGASSDPVLVNGAFIDNTWTEFCMFDSTEHGFDDSERGFGY